jgi:hypothetical protein
LNDARQRLRSSGRPTWVFQTCDPGDQSVTAHQPKASGWTDGSAADLGLLDDARLDDIAGGDLQRDARRDHLQVQPRLGELDRLEPRIRRALQVGSAYSRGRSCRPAIAFRQDRTDLSVEGSEQLALALLPLRPRVHVPIEEAPAARSHALEVRVRDPQLLRELPAGKRRDAVPLHSGGLLDFQGALAVLRRAVMRARQGHQQVLLRTELTLELPCKFNKRTTALHVDLSIKKSGHCPSLAGTRSPRGVGETALARRRRSGPHCRRETSSRFTANAAFVHGEAPRPGVAATSREPCPIARAR